MSDNPNIKQSLAEDDPWYTFMHFTTTLDEHNIKPDGWNWFWGLYYLSNAITDFPYLDIKAIQNKLPDEHWLKKIETDEYGDPFDSLFNEISQELLEINGFCIFQEYLEKIENPENLKKINFSNLDFRKIAIFSTLIFPIDTDFSNSTFSENALFTNAIFLETADFRGVKFHGETAKFRDTTFKKIADFTDAKFEHYANFKSSKFGGRTTFQRAEFKLHAPRFYGAKFNNEMTFSGMHPSKLKKDVVDQYLDFNKNKLENKITDANDIRKNYRKRIQENQNSYENTAILLGNEQKYHDQHLFFRQEMRCRQKLEHFLIKPFYWLYKWLANYGYGVGHAFVFWFLHICFGAIIIFIITLGTGLGTQQAFFCSASTSFANANPFVFIGFKEGGLTDCYKVLHYLLPIEFGTIRGIQTLFGIPLLFILLATLRIRFRLK